MFENRNRVTFIIILIFGLITKNQSANILILFTIPSLSNQIMYQPIIDALASRNHNIVLVTMDPAPVQNRTWKNVMEIDIRHVSYEVWTKHLTEYYQKVFTISDKLLFRKTFEQINVDLTRALLSHASLRDLLNKDGQKFDVVIGSVMLLLNLAIAKKFNAPFIGIHPSDILNGVHYRLGNSFSNFYYPDPFYPHARSLWTLDGLKDRYNEYWLYSSVETLSLLTDQIVSDYFQMEEGTLSLLEKVDVLLLTTDYIWSAVRPVRPNTIFVGDTRLLGGKPLEGELEKFLRNATEGVVYLSLGSKIKSSHLSKDRLKVIISALASLPYHVLWKWESASLPELPPNILTAPWVFQQDVLAHPKIKVFVTHGGLLSIREALYHDVPVVVIPFFGDQHFNAMRVKNLGLGESLDYKTMTANDLQKAIQNVATNASFIENVRYISDTLFDQPSAAVNSAVWWVEYTIRHKDGTHFQHPQFSMAEYLMIDVAFVILSFLLLLMILTYLTIKVFLSKYSQKQINISKRFIMAPENRVNKYNE